MAWEINMNSNKITSLWTPTASTDATNKEYVDSKIVDTSNLVSKTWDTIAWEINMWTNKITSLWAPTASTDATNKEYVDSKVVDTSNLVSKTWDTMAWEINMNSNKITSLWTPTASTDATNKAYVDSISASTSSVSIPQIKYTPTTYNWNLWGISWANAKCASAFGSGWRMLRESDLMSFNYNHWAWEGWITNYNNYPCNYWTSTNASAGAFKFKPTLTTPFTTGYCTSTIPISCTNLP